MSKNEGIRVTLSSELVAALEPTAEKHFAGDVCAALKHAIFTLKFMSDEEATGNKIYLVDPVTDQTQRLIFIRDDFSLWENEL